MNTINRVKRIFTVSGSAKKALRKNLCKNNQLQKNDFVLRAAPTVHKNQYPQLAISFEDRFAA